MPEAAGSDAASASSAGETTVPAPTTVTGVRGSSSRERLPPVFRRTRDLHVVELMGEAREQSGHDGSRSLRFPDEDARVTRAKRGPDDSFACVHARQPDIGGHPHVLVPWQVEQDAVLRRLDCRGLGGQRPTRHRLPRDRSLSAARIDREADAGPEQSAQPARERERRAASRQRRSRRPQPGSRLRARRDSRG